MIKDINEIKVEQLATIVELGCRKIEMIYQENRDTIQRTKQIVDILDHCRKTLIQTKYTSPEGISCGYNFYSNAIRYT